MRKSIVTCILFICLGSSYIAADEPNIEQLFKAALNAKGKAYVEIRQNILSLQPQYDSYLKKQTESSDLQTRIIAQAILDRAAKPQEYRHFEELMIVPITVAAKYGRHSRAVINPFETIKGITQIPKTSRSLENRRTVIDVGVGTPSQTNYHSYCHDDSAFLFMAEMAMKDTMLDLPELSEQVEWTDGQKTYTLNATAKMLGVLPQTAEKWHQTGIFLVQWDDHRIFIPMQTDSNDLPDSISQFQIRNFYVYFSDKIINPEYLESIEPVSRVVHADAIDAAERFQQDPGSLSRCYAVLMLRNFAKPETPELLYKIYKDDISEYVRLYCVEGFSAQTQVEQIKEAMKAFYIRVEPDDSNITSTTTRRTNVKPGPVKVPLSLIRKEAFKKSRENPDTFDVSDYIESIIPGDDRFNLEIAKILVDQGDKAAIEPLIEMLGYSSSNRDFIAKSIIAIDPNSMYKALEHQDSNIRESAWVSLASYDVNFPLKFEYLINHLDDDLVKIQDRIINPMLYSIMGLISRDYPDSLISFLDNTNPNIRERTLDLLVSNPDKYIPKESPSIKEILLSYVHDTNPSFRRTVLNKLKGYISDEQVHTVFLNELKDTDYGCRIEAIESLEDSAETVSILDNLLSQEKHPSVRNSAVHKLSKNKEPSRYRIFVMLISDGDYQVRRKIAQELSDWGDEQVIEIFKNLLNDSNSEVKRIAITYIAKNDIGLLKEVLSDIEPELRKTAYESFDRMATDEIIELLIKGTQDENAIVQSAAIWNLTRQKYSKELDDPVVSAVRKCLSDDNPKVRSNAIYALYEMVGNKSFEVITGYLYDPDTNVKRQAIGTLMRFNNPGILKYLMEALAKEEDKATLVELVSALREITGNLLTKDEWMQWWAENKGTYLQ